MLTLMHRIVREIILVHEINVTLFDVLMTVLGTVSHHYVLWSYKTIVFIAFSHCLFLRIPFMLFHLITLHRFFIISLSYQYKN